MSDLNQVQLAGRLGADPEVRQTNSGKAVCQLRLATNEKRGDKEETQWHTIITFGPLAEVCGKRLKKGSRVFINGNIRYRKAVVAEQERYFTDINANSVTFLDAAPLGNGNDNAGF